MAEYIEREALLLLIEERKLNTCNGTVPCLQMQRMVERIPAADVAPVRHGRWIDAEVPLPWVEDDVDVALYCSACGAGDGLGETTYCPDCGARMDGGAENA